MNDDFQPAPFDPERRLALSYVSTAKRGRLAALWALDLAFGDVLRTGRDPMIRRIRLAWWRDALEALDHAPPPAEPLLTNLATQVLPLGVSGSELAAMEAGWCALLEPQVGPTELDDYASVRGGRLFELSARLLDVSLPLEVAAAGELWSLVDLARRSSREQDAAAALGAARTRTANLPRRWPMPLRPIGMLAALAARDARGHPHGLELQGSPARMARMFGHWLTGR